MQEGRLFRIVYYLLDKGKATAPELAKHFEVSVRTIYRDVDAISSAGIPIYAETGRNGGIRFYDDFVLDKVVLSAKEKQEVLSALQGLDITNGLQEKETLTKLSALFHMNAQSWYEIDFSRWGNPTKDNQKFEDLKKAVLAHHVVHIVYVSSYGDKTKRHVFPYKLIYKGKAWYLKAYCEDKEAFRTFKCNRIIEWRIEEERFPPISIPEKAKRISTPSYPKITLRFPKEMAYRIYDEFEDEQMLKEEDGAYLVQAEMPEDAWLYGFLLSFGTQVEVVEPTYLRKALAKLAKEIYEKHKP